MPSLSAMNSENAYHLERQLIAVTQERDDLKRAFACSIAVERLRQMEVEGWTPEHDDEHGNCELARAAIAYIASSLPETDEGVAHAWFPWDMTWWKPSDDPIRDLEKAGALIAAEIDRRLRHQPTVTK